MENFHVIILAAGKGKRMKTEKPKPLIEYQGRSFLAYVLQAVKDSGICPRPTIVINPVHHPLFLEAIGEKYQYVFQKEQLGTGHAVLSCREALINQAENIIVFYGDHPLITGKTVEKIAEIHKQNKAVVSLLTIKIPDFQDWRRAFYGYGRIIRDQNGQLVKVVELKDCTEEQKQILEVNPSYFCFSASWLWENLKLLKNNNKQGEYYLTDMVGMAIEQNQKVVDVLLDDPKEGLGVNSVEELAVIKNIPK